MDCVSGLPIYELTTTAEAADSCVALDILAGTHRFFSVKECTFLAEKGYDVKNIYNQVSPFMTVSVSSPLTNGIQKIQSFFHREILFVMQVLPCGKMVDFQTKAEPVKYSVAL